MLNIIKVFIRKREIRNCLGNEIDKEQLNNYKKGGAILLDVRSPQEYKEGHLNGAISIPDYKIKKEIERIIPNKNQVIIVYCSTGIRSKKIQCTMEKMGYNNVYNLKVDF